MVTPMKPRAKVTLACFVYCCLHLTAHLSARFFETTPGVSVWYPSAGLALALLIILGVRYAPVVLVANIAGAFLDLSAPVWTALAFPLLITVNYAAAAYAIRRYIGGGLLPESGFRTLSFVSAIVVAPLGAAVGGTIIAALVHTMSLDECLRSALHWWLGDAVGMITVVPVIMVFVAPWFRGVRHPLQRWRWNARFVGMVAAQLLALVGSLWFVFTQSTLPHGTLYICFLPLIWTCLRHGIPGAAAATLALVMGSLIGMKHSPQTDGHLLSYSLFAIVVSAVGLGLGSAVTRRNEVRRALASSRAQFDRVIEGAHAGLWDWNVTTGRVSYNRRCAHLLHRDPAHFGDTWDAWERAIHASDRARNRAAMQAHLRGESRLYDCEYRVQTEDGRWRWIHSRGSVVQHNDAGAPEIFSGTHIDVTDRRLTDAAAKRLLTILESSTDFVLTIGPHGHIAYANASMLRLLNIENPAEIEGQKFSTVFPATSADRVQTEVIPTTLAKGTWHGELLLRGPDRDGVPVSTVTLVHRETETDGSGSLLSFVMRDISAQKQTEAENLERERRYLQVQRAESLNVLAGGIAHDFNNLLTAILGNATLVSDELAQTDPHREPLRQIELAAHRAAELCKNLLVYAGKFHVRPTRISLNAVVKESRDLIQPAISKKITIDLDLAEPPPYIRASASQLQQVIINLTLNAHEAIGDQPGRIHLRTVHRQVTESTPVTDFHGKQLSPGAYVSLEVADSGCGIPESAREKIFEPFFTTKAAGHGLGLAAASGIIRAHRGIIEIDTEPGHGTVFRVTLPAAMQPEPVLETPSSDADSWTGTGLALVVDDEEMVRTVTAKLLERFGFRTVTANDGADGVAAFTRHHHELAFVLTDLAMPRMSGDEAITEMRRINKAVPILLMSGYPEKMGPDHFAKANPSALLAKPIRPEVLRQTLRQVLTKS